MLDVHHLKALARAHGGQLTQAQATQLLESDDLQHGGRPTEAASALWAEVGLQVHMLSKLSSQASWYTL